jgi:drug/metabolite transporter (DMT)-like permease
MPYLLLVIIVASIAAQNALKKQYNLHSKKPAPFFFSLVLSLIAMLFFIATSGFHFEFDPGIIVYSIGFAISYGAALIGAILAIASGPLALTLLFSSYSLLIPTVHGLIALDEKLGIAGIIGLALLFLSILFINIKKENEKINLKWLVYVLISFFGNGFCSLVQKLEQIEFNGAYKNEFMVLALLICSVMLTVLSVCSREDVKSEFKRCLLLGGISGACNGAVNYSVLIAAGLLPSSVLYPSISAGGIVCGFLIAVLLYKEKLTKLKYVGYALGLVSVILLNI